MDLVGRPDLGFRNKATKEWYGFVGCKRSFRERAYQDILLAVVIKSTPRYRNTFWIEQHYEEKRKNKGNPAILIQRKRREAGRAWDVVFSQCDEPRSKEICEVQFIKLLKAALTGRPGEINENKNYPERLL
jgi:hypothetical protein